MAQLAFWRDISLVILGLECLVILIVLVALNYVLVRLTANLHAISRNYARKTQRVTDQVVTRTEQYAAVVRQPVVEADKGSVYVRESVRTFFRRTNKPTTNPASDPLKE